MVLNGIAKSLIDTAVEIYHDGHVLVALDNARGITISMASTTDKPPLVR